MGDKSKLLWESIQLAHVHHEREISRYILVLTMPRGIGIVGGDRVRRASTTLNYNKEQ